MAMDRSGFIGFCLLIQSMSTILSQPETTAPNIKSQGSRVPLNRKAMPIPGNMLCATASPTRLFFLKNPKTPTTDAVPPKSMQLKTTERMFGSVKLKNSRKAFIQVKVPE